MKILFFSLFLPHPRANHAAAFSDYNLLRCLSRHHEVTLLCLAKSASEQNEAFCLQEFCERVETVILPTNLNLKLRSRLRVLALTPISVAQCYCRAMAESLRVLCEREYFDVLHAEYTPMGQYVGKRLRCGVRSLSVHDLIARQMLNRAAYLPFSRRKLECRLDALLAGAYQARLCARFDVVFAHARRIRSELLARRPDLNVIYFPPGVDVPVKAKEHAGKGKHLVFMGAMWREENVDAILYFYHEIFRLIRVRIPDATLTIVGGSPAEAVKRLASDPQVRVTGFVEDLRACYMASDVSVAPMRLAGGILCKILDAMAAGLPVVTTPSGNEGVGAQAPGEILTANSPEEFAAQVVRLLDNPQLRDDLSRKGRDFVRRNFGRELLLPILENTYARLCGKRAGDIAM